MKNKKQGQSLTSLYTPHWTKW